MTGGQGETDRRSKTIRTQGSLKLNNTAALVLDEVDVLAAFGPGLHRTATGLVEELVDCSGGDEISLESGTQRKLEALQEALDRVRSPRAVVFCNKIETCRVVENALKRKDGQYQPPMVLVCTDRTSRGIDSMWCEHVVLFEFPRDPSEYVRRVGRTARGAGGRGVVTVLVLGKQVPLAKDILARNKEGAPVHRVPRLWKDE
eukprot:gene10116-10274_t